MTFADEKTFTIEGIRIPDSSLARAITQLVRDTESALLFHHSSRVYYWGALAGKRRALRFDPELLYAGAMFHDMGLTPAHRSAHERFEVDGANVARDFLRSRGIGQRDIDTVWTAIALHTTPGIPQHMHPVVALVTAGVEMDVLGLAYDEYSEAQREAVVHAHPRPRQFKEDIIQAFYDGIKHKPDTTFGNVKADVLADKDPAFTARQFLQRNSRIGLERLTSARSGVAPSECCRLRCVVHAPLSKGVHDDRVSRYRVLRQRHAGDFCAKAVHCWAEPSSRAVLPAGKHRRQRQMPTTCRPMSRNG